MTSISSENSLSENISASVPDQDNTNFSNQSVSELPIFAPKGLLQDHTYSFAILNDICSRRGKSVLSLPRTYEKAVSGPDADAWNLAIATEFSSHARNNTWDVVP